MKTFTNHTPGARGINLKGGATHWLEPGQSVDLDPKEIVGAVPDLGKAPTAGESADNPTEVAELRSALDAITRERDDLKTEVAELRKEAAASGPDPELIKAAVDGLNPKNDDHWTQAGLPEVAAVKAALGADVTRAQIEAAAPDAKRPAA